MFLTGREADKDIDRRERSRNRQYEGRERSRMGLKQTLLDSERSRNRRYGPRGRSRTGGIDQGREADEKIQNDSGERGFTGVREEKHGYGVFP